MRIGDFQKPIERKGLPTKSPERKIPRMENPPRQNPPNEKSPATKSPEWKIHLAIRICICNRAFTFSSRKSF